jgi:hypothetical protein
MGRGVPLWEVQMIDDEEDTLDDTIHPDEDVEDDPSPEEEVEEDSDFARAIESFFDPDSVEAKRLARRIDISGYEDAFYEDDRGSLVPKFEVGDRILVERKYSSRTGGEWYTTNAYTVKKLDYNTGDLSLWNNERGQWDLSNWITGTRLHGVVYKLPASYGNPFKKRARGRPPKVRTEPEVAAPPTTSSVPEDGKPRRGRPKGSKNRTKA